jgi:hypothetical protein
MCKSTGEYWVEAPNSHAYIFHKSRKMAKIAHSDNGSTIRANAMQGVVQKGRVVQGVQGKDKIPALVSNLSLRQASST